MFYSNTKKLMALSELHLAAKRGSVEAVMMLLRDGAETDERDKYGMTPLAWAVDRCHIDIVRILIAAGADVNASDAHGLTPLHRTCIFTDDVDIARLLVRAGADTTKTDKDGEMAFEIAQSNFDELLAAVKGQ